MQHLSMMYSAVPRVKGHAPVLAPAGGQYRNETVD